MNDEELMTDRGARAIRRYLDLLRDALLDEHYLENELRIGHLLECISTGQDVNADKLASPARHMASALERRQQERRAGELRHDLEGPAGRSNGLAYAALGRVRLEHLEACLDAIRREEIGGDLVEAGTGRG